MRADIQPGATFPDYELTDHARQRCRLSELQGDDPMVLAVRPQHRAYHAAATPGARRGVARHQVRS